MVQRLKVRNDQLEAKINMYEEEGMCLVGPGSGSEAVGQSVGQPDLEQDQDAAGAGNNK